MYLSNAPQTYAKGAQKRQVYYTAEARDLESLGWTLVTKASKPKGKDKDKDKEAVAIEAPKPEEKAPEPARIEAEVILEDSIKGALAQDLPTFEFMTKVELLQYAMDRGVDLPNNALKAELIEACKKL